jgi:DnaJ-domain-containing protein 1
VEHDTECAQAEAVQKDYRARLHAFTSGSKHSFNFSQMLEERQILLSLQKTELVVRKTKLAEEQARGIRPFDAWDLLGELEELHARVAGVEDEQTAEAGRMSTLVVGIYNALVDLGMLLIQDNP